jgi:hypothetical protein
VESARANTFPGSRFLLDEEPRRFDRSVTMPTVE